MIPLVRMPYGNYTCPDDPGETTFSVLAPTGTVLIHDAIYDDVKAAIRAASCEAEMLAQRGGLALLRRGQP